MIGPSDFPVSSTPPCRSARRRQRPERPRVRDPRCATRRGGRCADGRSAVCARARVRCHPRVYCQLTVLKNCAPATLLQWASFHSANVAHVLITNTLTYHHNPPPCPDVMHATWRGGATTDRKLTQASSWAVGKTRGTEKEITGSSDQLRRAAAHTAPQLSAKLG